MIHDILNVLDKVRPTGHSEWVACCPAHEDRSPSLAVKDNGDGRILLHCFAGCAAQAVLDAIGLTFADVLPERLSVEGLKPLKWNPRTVLEAIAHDVEVIALLAEDASDTGELTMAQRDLIFDRSAEIREAIRYATR